jgi:hypothetical protein
VCLEWEWWSAEVFAQQGPTSWTIRLCFEVSRSRVNSAYNGTVSRKYPQVI